MAASHASAVIRHLMDPGECCQLRGVVAEALSADVAIRDPRLAGWRREPRDVRRSTGMSVALAPKTALILCTLRKPLP